ncbi:MAG: cysteine synthase A [Lentisphaeraceae bacterium]|nr:cysteine synthase A [Lentisphaeraceae bacterium]
MSNIASDILEVVGNTPLVRINRLNNGNAEIYVKLEEMNTGSSVKTRIAKQMIDDAIADGSLKEGMTVIEPTSGNTGIGLAIACVARGFKLILTMPDTMSFERRQILRVFGAELVLTPGAEGMPGAIRRAEELLKETEGGWVAEQFNNPSNPKAHYEGTAREIWRDTDGEVDIFVSGVGTGGTLTGCAKFFKEQNTGVKVVAVEPATSAVISGEQPGKHKIQGIGAGFIPKNLETELVDAVELVTDEEAGECARQLALKEGIFGGISCGAALAAALKLSRQEENAGKKIVVILPDTGERYLSTWLYDQYKS